MREDTALLVASTMVFCSAVMFFFGPALTERILRRLARWDRGRRL